MFKKIWAYLTRGKVVWLRDFDGEVHRRIAYNAGKSKMVASTMLFGKWAVLEEGGKVSYPSYTDEWWYE